MALKVSKTSHNSINKLFSFKIHESKSIRKLFNICSCIAMVEQLHTHEHTTVYLAIAHAHRVIILNTHTHTCTHLSHPTPPQVDPSLLSQGSTPTLMPETRNDDEQEEEVPSEESMERIVEGIVESIELKTEKAS